MRGIDDVETGIGPTVLFVPGSYSTHAAWRQIQKLMVPAYRMVGTSLYGYGTTIETRTRDDFDIPHELRIVEAAARRAGGPVHLVGHSFGGTVALAALKQALPDARAAVVQGAGHFLITSQASECAALLNGFLGEVGEQTGDRALGASI